MCVINEVVALALSVAILLFILDSGLHISIQRRAFIAANIAVISASVFSVMTLIVTRAFPHIDLVLYKLMLAGHSILVVLIAYTFANYAFSVLINTETVYDRFKRMASILFAITIPLIITLAMTTDKLTIPVPEGRPLPYLTITPVIVFFYVLWILIIAMTYRSQALKQYFGVIFAMTVVSSVAIIVQLHIPSLMLNSITAAFILVVASLYLQNKKTLLDDGLDIQNRTAFNKDIKRIKATNQDILYLVSVIDYATFHDTKDSQFALDVMVEVTNQLARIFGRSTLYRYQSDTLAIHPDLRTIKGSKPVKEQLRDLFSQTFVVDQSDLLINTSILCYQGDLMIGVDPTSVIDYALSTFVKNEGSTMLDVTPLTIQDHQREKAITKTLHEKLMTGGIDVHFQPIYDTPSKTFKKAEALARLYDPVYGPISPLEFIPIAERASLINFLSYSVIKTSLETLRCLEEHASTIETISINISGTQVGDISFPEHVVDLINIQGNDPGSLSFELTETVMVSHMQSLKDFASAFKAAGITLTLDDFGTGVSNIESVLSGLFETIKFDGNIFHDLTRNRTGSSAIRHLIALFKSLGIRTTIEGIETKEQKDSAIGAGADELQGYFLAMPMTKEDLLALMMPASPDDSKDEL